MPKRSVWLVEDDHTVADMYRLGLETRGFDVAAYSDGPSLFEALEEKLPDVLILDWILLPISGGQILDRLRLDDRTRRLPVFILSGISTRQRHYAEDVASRLGVIRWLEKMNTPPAVLADKVAAIFELIG